MSHTPSRHTSVSSGSPIPDAIRPAGVRLATHPRARLRLLIALLAASLSGACGRKEAGPGEGPGGAPGGPPGQQGQPPQVTVVTLAPESVQLTRELPGRVRAYLVAEVRPQVNGIIEKRLFTEGGEVKAGQALYQLEDDTYRADLQSARAALQRAKAAVRVARVTANRSRQLVQAGIISKQDHDNNAAALQLAQADEKSAEAAAQRAEVVLQYARITAPISGNIGTSAVTAGALVTANQQSPLALVQQLDPVYVDLTQSSGELLELRRQLAAGSLERQKTPVSILLEDGSTYSHEGQLEFSDVTVDPGTGSFLLRVVVPNPERVLMPGMYVRAVIGRGMRSNALLVPQQGVTRDPKGNATAMVVGKDGKVAVKQVQTSRALGDRWLVEGGLAAGDRVIIEGLQKIRPGIQVKATEATREQKATGGSGRPGGARQPAGGQAPPARGE